MKSIVFIIPYYGKFPDNFSIWCKSVGYNRTIDFYIFTDIKENRIYKDNIKYIDMSFSEFKQKIQACVEFPIILDEPYKLCDYKPVYGEALQEYIYSYDFWGYCDVDLVFGDIRKFLKNDILNKYSKIFKFGHCTLYKNSKEINSRWKEKHHVRAYRYDEAFKTKYCCHFDETGGISDFYDINDRYDKIVCADIIPRYKYFKQNELQKHFIPQIYSWVNGKLYCYYLKENKIEKKEFLYVHFQKRNMKNRIKDINCVDEFYMIPNQYIYNINIFEQLYSQNKNNLYIRYRLLRGKEIYSNIKKGAIWQRVYKLNLEKNRKRLKM